MNDSRTNGLDDPLLGRILDIFHGHLNEQKRDPLDQHAIQTIPQFMFERKDLVIKLLNYAECCEQVRIEVKSNDKKN